MASKNSETSWRVVGDKKSRFIFGNQQTFYFGRFIRFLFTIPSSSLNFKPFCPTHSKTWVSQDLHIFMLIPGIFLGNHFVVVLAFSYFFYFQDHYTMASRLKWTTQVTMLWMFRKKNYWRPSEAPLKKINGPRLPSWSMISYHKSKELQSNAGKNITTISFLEIDLTMGIGPSFRMRNFLTSIRKKDPDGKIFQRAFQLSNFFYYWDRKTPLRTVFMETWER